jgi:hypothetical protein
MEAAFDSGVVAGEAVELGGELGVVEDVEVGLGRGGEFGFHATDAAEIPGGRHELVEQNPLEGALRPDVGLKLDVELVEFFTVLSGDDELGGGESMLSRVLGRAGLASSVRGPVLRQALAAFAV